MRVLFAASVAALAVTLANCLSELEDFVLDNSHVTTPAISDGWSVTAPDGSNEFSYADVLTNPDSAETEPYSLFSDEDLYAVRKQPCPPESARNRLGNIAKTGNYNSNLNAVWRLELVARR